MAGFSTYFAQQIISEKFVSGPTKYLALFVADPTDNNVTANEVTGAWYARQAVTSWAAPVGTGVATSNSNAIQFPAVTGSSVTVTHWAIYDALTSGNLIASGIFGTIAVPSPKILNVDDVFVIAANNLTLTFD